MASYSSSSPIPRKLADLMHGYIASQAVFSACELGIFDALFAAGEPQSATTLSAQLSTDEKATSRLLDVLAHVEMVVKHTGSDGPLYSITKEAHWLTSSSPMNLKGFIMVRLQTSNALVGNLTNAVREGESQWQRTFNATSEEMFEHFYASEEKKIAFLEAMRGISRPGAHFLVSAFDLSRFKTMCDLGGGTGDVAYTACAVYPDMKITVVDLPTVVQCSPHFRPSMEQCPNQKNVTFVEGDFFGGTLPSADLYVMTRVMHDWGEDRIDIILSKVFNSLPSGGGILIGELLINDDRSGPFFPLTYDLLILAICDKGARERSGLEFKQLLEKHGFEQVQYKVTGSNSLDAVMAIKP